MAEAETTVDTDHTPKKRSGKRVSVACDECRLRKSKCDGLRPCEACQQTERYCTYNLSAGRSTGSGTRIRILEDRLRRARAYLVEAQRRTPSLAHVNFDALLGPTDDSTQVDETKPPPLPEADEAEDDEYLSSMMDSYGHLTLDSNQPMERDFYGAASGLAWITKTTDYFERSSSGQSSSHGDDDIHDPAAVQLFDAPLPPKNTIKIDTSSANLMPPRRDTTKLLDVVLTQVYPLFHFLDEQDFETSTDRLYSQDRRDYTDADRSFLPLFYAVTGLGHMFSRQEHDRLGCRAAVARGTRLFLAARSMLDIAHLRTIVSLQSTVCIVLFLVSTARMGSAHAFMGATCAAALRQGLHFRTSHEDSIPVREKRVRRKVFWAVMNLDMYISSILGLPQFMDLSAVDPAIDLTIDAALGEYRSDLGLSSRDGLILAATAKHIEVMRVIFRAQRTLYPMPSDPPDSKEQNGTIMVSVQRLQDVEHQFRQWAESLAEILTFDDDSRETQSIKYEIHISYYFAQIILYRPFIHYLAEQTHDKTESNRQLSYAHTCVQMASKVVEISVQHQIRGLLCPAGWSAVYTVFVSISCLIFAYATRKGSQLPQVREDIENGIRLLACTACTTDTGSVRCLEILRRLIKRVSRSVDIDVDTICAETTPCCPTDFTSRGVMQRTLHLTDVELPADMRSQSISDAATSGSGRTSVVGIASEIQHTTSSASKATGPFPVNNRHHGDDQTSVQGQRVDEMMGLSFYPHAYAWPQDSPVVVQRSAPDPLQGPARMEDLSPLNRSEPTAAQIAAFMQNSGEDDPFDPISGRFGR